MYNYIRGENIMAETKKTTTAKTTKSTGTKTVKKTETKTETKGKEIKTAPKKTTTTKTTAAKQPTKSKTTGTKSAAKKTTTTATSKSSVTKNTNTPKKTTTAKKKAEPKKVTQEKKEEVINPPIQNIIEEKQPVIKEEKIENIELNEKNASKDKLVDLGILIVIVGLFILVLTTYLTSSLDLSYRMTNNLVIVSLIVEAIGICVIIANSIRRK